MTRICRIGAGAGFADDRIEPALALAEAGAIDALVFECLAERTIARESLARRKNPDSGFNPRLAARMQAVLPACIRHGIRVITNMGAANPLGAARVTAGIAGCLGLPLRVAALTGDDVADLLRAHPGLTMIESGRPVEDVLPDLVAANAYLGADAVLMAIRTGAEVVITGRVADPSLFLAPVMHHFGWNMNDLSRIAAGTTMGHLLECAAQVTGGCFADPTRREKYVEGLADLGNPIAEIDETGSLVITKLPGTGGRVDRRTCTEQLLYEVHDPAAYLTPDCVLDLTQVDLFEEGKDRVRVAGATARPRPDRLKVTVAYAEGFVGVGEVGYAGIGAVARARLAADVVQDRLRRQGHVYDEVRVDLIGQTSLHGQASQHAVATPEPYEVRLRIAARARDRAAAQAVGFETRAMHVNGPTGGGGGSDPVVRDMVAVQSVLMPRDLVAPQVQVHVMEPANARA